MGALTLDPGIDQITISHLEAIVGPRGGRMSVEERE